MTSLNHSKSLHVAVGVIKNNDGEILISRRHDSAHQGGLWEFPGGKVETDETVEQALERELKEELGINVQQMQPLIRIRHAYPDLDVLLDVWQVLYFTGTASGRENQAINWVAVEKLGEFNFPEANYPIINAIKLPVEYAILNANRLPDLLEQLQLMLAWDIKFIQARIKPLLAADVSNFIDFAQPLCKQKGVTLLINSAVKGLDQLKVDGVHLTSEDLLKLQQRPENYNWVAASCHDLSQLHHAEKIGVDFVVLAPVLPTQTHPSVVPLGWEQFADLCDKVNLPVFALGGMKRSDVIVAKKAGAQGVSGITTFLS